MRASPVRKGYMEGSYAPRQVERNGMMENYLQVLEESLRKKVNVLERISEVSSRQERMLKSNPVPEEDFDQSIEEKGVLIEELSKLDEGFETLYGNIREQLMAGKDRYKLQIAAIQALIAKATEQSVSIQAQEARNKLLADRFFSDRKQELQKSRKSSKAAMDYYRNMSQSQVVMPQFMDRKK